VALNYVAITGTFLAGNDVPVSGQVVFTPSETVYASGVPVVSTTNPVTVQVISGSLQSVSLLATDNSGLTYAGLTGFFTWSVSITLNGVSQPGWSFFLPHSPSTVDLYALANTAASGGFINPMTSAGDLIDGGTGGAAQRLGIGSSGQVLTVSGGAPAWETPSPALPLTTLGDIVYENATPAPARLPGNTSAVKNFLTQTGTGSVSAAPAWGTIAAADLPSASTSTQGAVILDGTAADIQPSPGTPAAGAKGQAADAEHVHGQPPVLAPTGLTGATAASRYAGATTSGPPASGTFAAGDYVVDQTGIIWACFSAGTPGTWKAWGDHAWQFRPEAYGAKGDGLLALVTVVSGNATINTTPLGAPSAPTVSNSGSGGTVLAGTYKAEVTYVNRWGETLASSETSTTTSGSTSVITISPPALLLDATGWYAYVTQAGGSTYTRQQASGSPTAMGVQLILTAPPTSSGANPPGSDTSAAQVFTSTAADSGKNIMICGAEGTPGGPAIDTIASVNSPTQAVLTSGTSTITASASGCAMVFSSDDRLAIDACMTAARNYALTADSMCQVIFSEKIYGLGASLFQTASSNNTGTWTYNTQVRLPVANASGEVNKFEVQVLGAGDGGHCQFWLSPNLNMPGTALISYSIGPNSTPDATYGQQSIVGGPTGGFLSAANGFSNSKAVVKGLTLVQPGWSNSIGLDLNGMAECNIDGVTSTAFAPSTDTPGVNPYSGWNNQSFWLDEKIAAGVRLPAALNNDEILVNSLCVQGLNIGVLSQADHVIIHRLSVNSVDTVIKLSLGGNEQHEFAARISAENFNTGVATAGTGSKVMCEIVLDAENAGGVIADFDVNDPANQLFGTLWWNDFSRTSGFPAITGAANLKIINCQMGPGQWTGAMTPAVPAVAASGTVVTNTAWRDAMVYLSSAGGAVSTVKVDSATTGLTLGTAGAVSYRVPGGHTTTLTYASSAPTWVWVLD
jgi:hypothetical protein